jgi:hypothetical protein
VPGALLNESQDLTEVLYHILSTAFIQIHKAHIAKEYQMAEFNGFPRMQSFFPGAAKVRNTRSQIELTQQAGQILVDFSSWLQAPACIPISNTPTTGATFNRTRGAPGARC